MPRWIYGISLLDGWFPATLMVCAIVAALVLLVRGGRKWIIFALVALAAALGAAFLSSWLTVHVFYVWPEDLPTSVVVWAAAGIAALFMGIGTYFFRPRLWRRAVAPIAVVLVIAFAGLQVNAYFGLLTSVGDLLGHGNALATGIPGDLRKTKPGDPYEIQPVADGWKRPAVLRDTGIWRQVDIPGTKSGFTARDAVVYLPGAYLLKHRPKLPVLVLVAGNPGSPTDWINSAHLGSIINTFAAKHDGLAPVVVIPDPAGSEYANTMCMNSSLGNADTYLATDVPNWIKANLDIDDNPHHWAVGGFSFGATCAMQMATRHRKVYPNFLSISSEREPALAVSQQVTVDEAFGGNTKAFISQTPLTLMAKKKYPGTTGYFSAGTGDALYSANAKLLYAAAEKSHMHVKLHLTPGGHSWLMVIDAMPGALNYLAKPLGLVT